MGNIWVTFVLPAGTFFVLFLCLFSNTISATDELIPDIDLLEFLGTIAGLEGMGVEIDLLLENPLGQEAEIMNDGDIKLIHTYLRKIFLCEKIFRILG